MRNNNNKFSILVIFIGVTTWYQVCQQYLTPCQNVLVSHQHYRKITEIEKMKLVDLNYILTDNMNKDEQYFFPQLNDIPIFF